MGTQSAPARFLQANLHHAAAAAAVVECCLVERKADLALIQEPWVHNSTILGLNAAGKVLYNTSGTKPRACIIFNNNTEFLPVAELCTDDLIAAYVNLKGWRGPRVIVCSAYLPGEKTNPSAELIPVVEYAQRHNAELLVGCDANAHHTNWGSTDVNDRGELLNDFLIANCLQTLNNGCEPTFVTRVRQEVLDITFATINLARHIFDWRVSDENSMSDHRHICFNLTKQLSTQTVTFRDPRRTDWAGYCSHLERNLESVL